MEVLARDWSDDFSLWYATYPGLDPGKCTIKVFQALLAAAHRTTQYKFGGYDEKAAERDDVKRLNRKLTLQPKFPMLLPEDPID